jgi:hypothetical protein
MRTWKQGTVGRISDDSGTFIFFRCLKYPLAQFYREYSSSSSMLEGWICDAYLDVSVLRHMERLAILKVSKAELNEKSKSEDEGILGIHGLFTKLKAHDSQQ